MAVVLGMACLALAHLCAAADGVAFDTIRIKARDLPGVTGHVQGMCVSDDAIFLSTHNAVVKADWSGKVLALRRFESHMGDLAFHDGRIYCTWSRTQGGKKEPVILVLDADLKEVTRKTIPDVPGCDGIAVMDGRVYFGVGRMIKEPHRVNTVGMLDMDLDVKGFKDVDYGVETNFGVQNMCVLDGKIYAFFYTHLGGKKGAPLKCCILDKELNVLSAEPFAAGQGIDVAPARFGGSAERPVFVRSHSPGKIARDDPEAVYVSISFWTYAGGKARPLASGDGKKTSKTKRKDAKQ